MEMEMSRGEGRRSFRCCVAGRSSAVAQWDNDPAISSPGSPCSLWLGCDNTANNPVT